VENGGGKIVPLGRERGEMKAYEMGTFGFDAEVVGRGSGEDPGRVVQIGGIWRWVLILEGDASWGGEEGEAGVGIGEEDAVVDGGGRGGATAEEVVI